MNIDLGKILAGLVALRVPVEIGMDTGFCGEDSTDTMLIGLNDVLSLTDFDDSVYEYAYEMAKQNAESHGSDTQDCGECDGCHNSDGCEEPLDNESIGSSISLFDDENQEPDINEKSYTAVWCAELGFWVALGVPELAQRTLTAEESAMTESRKATKLALQVAKIKRILAE